MLIALVMTKVPCSRTACLTVRPEVRELRAVWIAVAALVPEYTVVPEALFVT